MDVFVRRFIRASLAWLGIGVLIGISMSFWPGEALAYRPAHVHANLLGFVSMMIFGVAYHVIPRFSGNPLRSRPAAHAHFWIAQVGLALLVGGWIVAVTWYVPGTVMLRAGAVLSAVGAFLFIGNIWRTLDARAVRPVTRAPMAAAAAAAPAAHGR